MTSATRHIIERYVLQISASTLDQARRCESQANSWVHGIVLPVLVRCFDNLVPIDRHLIFERLELDLGVFSEDRLPKDLEQRLERAIREAIQKSLGTIRTSTDTTFRGRPAARTGATPSVPHGAQAPSEAFNDDRPQEPFLLEARESDFEALLYYLQKGRLPWWKRADAGWLDAGWIGIGAWKEADIDQLRHLISRSTNARMRLAVTFSSMQIVEVIRRLGGHESVWKTWDWQEKALQKHPHLLASLRQHYWASALYEVSILGKAAHPEHVFQRILEDTPAILEAAWPVLRPFVQDRKNDAHPVPPVIPATLKKAMKILENYFGSREEIPPLTGMKATKDYLSKEKKHETRLPKGKKDEPWPRPLQANALSDSSHPEDNRESVFIDDAGLVLLHPFFLPLFRARGLLEKDRFISSNAAASAVRLLDWLVWGQDDLRPEYRLLLPKMLCGIPWETPLEAVSGVSDDDRATALELLQAVVGHWTALKNTSPEGLRDGFLRRAAKLSPRGSDWHLDVEQKPQDVLLSRLPWGYSTLRLPWMTSILYVNWS